VLVRRMCECVRCVCQMCVSDVCVRCVCQMCKLNWRISIFYIHIKYHKRVLYVAARSMYASNLQQLATISTLLFASYFLIIWIRVENVRRVLSIWKQVVNGLDGDNDVIIISMSSLSPSDNDVIIISIELVMVDRNGRDHVWDVRWWYHHLMNQNLLQE